MDELTLTHPDTSGKGAPAQEEVAIVGGEREQVMGVLGEELTVGEILSNGLLFCFFKKTSCCYYGELC